MRKRVRCSPAFCQFAEKRKNRLLVLLIELVEKTSDLGMHPWTILNAHKFDGVNAEHISE